MEEDSREGQEERRMVEQIMEELRRRVKVRGSKEEKKRGYFGRIGERKGQRGIIRKEER